MSREFEKIIKYADLCKLLDIDPNKFVLDIEITPVGRNCFTVECTIADTEDEVDD